MFERQISVVAIVIVTLVSQVRRGVVMRCYRVTESTEGGVQVDGRVNQTSDLSMGSCCLAPFDD